MIILGMELPLDTELGATLLMGLRGGTATLLTCTWSGLEALETARATDLLIAPRGMLCTVSCCCVLRSESVSLVTEISFFLAWDCC